MTAVKGAMRPRLPAVGETVRLFGVLAVVTVVEPSSDWFWSIEAKARDGATLRVTLPTDFRTDDGTPATS